MGLDPKSLQVGQTVTVREMNFGMQIHPPREGELGLTILAVNRELLVLADAEGGTRSIPVYLIQQSNSPVLESSEAA